MIFIVMGKFRRKPDKESFMQRAKQTEDNLQRHGGKRLGQYFTFGRYDYVTIVEMPDKDSLQTAMKGAMSIADSVESETLIALKSEEAINLL